MSTLVNTAHGSIYACLLLGVGGFVQHAVFIVSRRSLRFQRVNKQAIYKCNVVEDMIGMKREEES